jgi:Methyltransferase domain
MGYLLIAMDPDVSAGIAAYTPFALALYDLGVVHFSCRFAWGCPSSELVGLYNRNIGSKHLDLGPGTGYYLDRCKFPVPTPAITLLDLNMNSLRYSARRLRRFRPAVVEGNALEPLPLNDTTFDSAALSLLLHCLPGGLQSKAVVFDHVKKHIRSGGTIFGSTVLGVGGSHGRIGGALMSLYNRKGVFHNASDSAEELDAELAKRFSTYSVRVVGAVALFEAKP